MKKVLVTGGAGFIGSHFSRRLVKQGHDVTIIDNLERGKLEYIEDIISEISFFNIDLREYYLMHHYFEDMDVVIHMASKVGGIGTYLSKPYEIITSNLAIDSNVLRASLENGVSKYFYASSAHIYPKTLQMTKDSPLIYESDAYPVDCELSYGWAKLIGEKQIEYALEEYSNFNASIARFVGIYGINQDYNLKTGSVIPVFSHRAIKYPELEFDVWGDGTETRSYCYIEDTLECIQLMIDKLDNIRLVGPLNVGKEERNSIAEIAEEIIKISDKNISIVYDKSKETKIWGQWCSCKEAKEVLGWEATTTLKDGLKVIYNDIKKRLKK